MTARFGGIDALVGRITPHVAVAKRPQASSRLLPLGLAIEKVLGRVPVPRH